METRLFWLASCWHPEHRPHPVAAAGSWEAWFATNVDPLLADPGPVNIYCTCLFGIDYRPWGGAAATDAAVDRRRLSAIPHPGDADAAEPTLTGYPVGHNERGELVLCQIRTMSESEVPLDGFVTAARRRCREARSRRDAQGRPGEMVCYMGPPRLGGATTAYALDRATKEIRQAEFSAVGIDMGGALVPVYEGRKAPHYAMALRLLGQDVRVWMEPFTTFDPALAALHDGRFPFVATEWWMTYAAGRPGFHGPATLRSEVLVQLDGSAGTPTERAAKALAWQARGCSVIVEPGGMSLEQRRWLLARWPEASAEGDVQTAAPRA